MAHGTWGTTTICFFTPHDAVSALDQLAGRDVRVRDLLERDWFPYQALKRLEAAGQAEVAPIETVDYQLYFALQSWMGEELEPPSELSRPGDYIRHYHGEEAASRYLAALRDAGWDERHWPPSPGDVAGA